MKENEIHRTSALIIRDFEIETNQEQITEEELLQILSDQIAYMIEYRIDFLMSLLYRLDVLEKDINKALHPASPEPANVALAKLVIERQKQRIRTKQTYKQPKLDDMEGWEF